MPRKTKPVPGHSTVVVTPVDAGRLDQEIHQQIYELLGIDDQVEREAFSEALNAWGRDAFTFYEAEKKTLPKKVVKATVHEIAKSAELLSGLLAQADTQSGGTLVVARALLRGKNLLYDREAPNDVVALNQIRQSVSDLCQIAKLATETTIPAKGRPPEIARNRALSMLVPLIQDFASKSLKRRTNRTSGEPEGALVATCHLCILPFENTATPQSILGSLRRLLECG